MEDNSTILIIDDNAAVSTLLQAIFTKDGYDTLQAESGPRGRMLARAHSPDLILLDVMMPGEGGFETCDALKLDPKTAGIPVIFLSSVSEAEEKVKGLTLGAVDYITKPFNRAELLARTRLHINLKQKYAAEAAGLNAAAKHIRDSGRAAPGRLDLNKPPISGLQSSVRKRAFISSLPNHVTLSPGEYYVSKEKVTIRTILGSCVAACLWDERNKVVGMNHFLLAEKRKVNNVPFSQTEAGKYGVYAMELLINAMLKLGARRENLKAKVFGGSSLLHSEDVGSLFAVGEENSRFIVEFLKIDGIPLVSSDLGGNVGRVIYFSSEDFSVYVKKAGKARQDKIVLGEKTFWAKSIEREEETREPEIWL